MPDTQSITRRRFVGHIAATVVLSLWLGTDCAAADAVRWNGQTRQFELVDDSGQAWVAEGHACVVLGDGERIRSDDPRFDASTDTTEQCTTVVFTDAKKQLDMQLVVTPLDPRAVTIALHVTNRSSKVLRLDRIEALTARLTDRHEAGRRHVLLNNGFYCSKPHATVRKAGVTSLASYETAALESPAMAAGWLTGIHNFGRIELKDLDEQPVVVAWGSCDGCELPAGSKRTSDLFFLSTHPQPLAEMERFATLAGKINKVKIWPPRIAWCTWYAGWQRKQMAAYKDGMERGIEQMIPEIKSHFASRGAKTMRICDDFMDYGDWSNNTKTIPRGFDRLARLIDAAGLTPGVWYSPYWAKVESKVLSDHPDWFARDKQGNIWFETGWQANSRDTTAFAVFDTSRPEVIDYFEETARGWRERGFRYVSTDFLIWAVEPDRYHDPTKTKAEVLRAGMAAIRRGLGPDVFYRPINNPLGVAMGIANDTRISGDSHGDNPTAYFRAAEAWFYNRRVWLNDPSAVVCARYGKLRDITWNRMWMSWMALAGTVLTYGEVIDELPEPYIRLYQRIFPNLPVAGRPLDIWENDPYLLWGMVPGEADGPYELFGVFDLNGKGPRQVKLNLDEISARCRGWSKPAAAPREYLLWDFWQQKLLKSDAEKLSISMPSKSCRLFAIRAKLARPQLLGTSGHFSQGVLETSQVCWDTNKAILSGKAHGNGDDPTTLFFHVPEGMTLGRASLSGKVCQVRTPEPNVVALDVPATAEPIAFGLTFEGRTGDIGDTRPFVPGRAAITFSSP